MPTYVKPIARHALYAERFLLWGEDDRWYVWTGEDVTAAPEEICEETARWLLTRRWICALPGADAWVHVADLPLAPGVGAPRRGFA